MRSRRTPPISIPWKSMQDSFWASPHSRQNLNIPTDIWRDRTERTRPGTDGPGTSLEPCSAPRTPTLFLKYPCRHQASADSHHCGGEIEISCMLSVACERWTMATPKTNRTPRGNLKLASRIEESPTIAERQKRLVTIDDLPHPTADATAPRDRPLV